MINYRKKLHYKLHIHRFTHRADVASPTCSKLSHEVSIECHSIRLSKMWSKRLILAACFCSEISSTAAWLSGWNSVCISESGGGEQSEGLVPSLLGRCKQKQRGLRGLFIYLLWIIVQYVHCAEESANSANKVVTKIMTTHVAGRPLLNGRCTSLLKGPLLRDDLYCVEWEVKLYSTQLITLLFL